jgi:hypothetical protein
MKETLLDKWNRHKSIKTEITIENLFQLQEIVKQKPEVEMNENDFWLYSIKKKIQNYQAHNKTPTLKKIEVEPKPIVDILKCFDEIFGE